MYGVTFLFLTLTFDYLQSVQTKRRLKRIVMTSKFEVNYSSNLSANHKIGFETVVIADCILDAPLMFLSIIVMILFYTPSFFVHIFSAINYLNSRILWTFPVTVAFINSSINPFLYCWRIPGLRTAVFKTARLLSCREMD